MLCARCTHPADDHAYGYNCFHCPCARYEAPVAITRGGVPIEPPGGEVPGLDRPSEYD